jgi:DNA-binding beta-propeller fold protein YncE
MKESRLQRIVVLCTSLCLALFSGCKPAELPDAEQVKVWGSRGIDPGRFQTPRAIAFGPDKNLYIVDKLGQIQVFDKTGNYLRSWRMPATEFGKPCGLSFSNDGLLMVADTHYFRILFYELDGTLVEARTIGGKNGKGPGEFGFVTDVVQDPEGNYYVSEYGDFDRIQKFSREGEYQFEWGGHGEGDYEFMRPQALALDELGRLWVADACNHRIQIFEVSEKSATLVQTIGHAGPEPGELKYPYALLLNEDKTFYVCEFGNHRLQKLDREGSSLGTFGSAGKGAGQFHQPWAFVIDDERRVHMLDTYNHRVQSFPEQLVREKNEN